MRVITILLLLLVTAGGPGPDRDASLLRLLRTAERHYIQVGDPTDVRSLATRLEFDRGRIFEFVRNEIAYEPYEGVLRGASGTLFARSGNAIDQSLLLFALLEAGGERARIVQGPIPDEGAAKLLEMFLAGQSGSKLPERKRAAEKVVRELGVDREALDALLFERENDDSTLIDEVLEGSDREASRLQRLLGDRLASGTLDAPRQHYWVQVFDEGWKDLDPTGIEFDRKGAGSLGDRDLASLQRFVKFTLILERSVGEKTDSVPLLDVTLPLESVAWKAVDLVIHPEAGELPEPKEFSALSEQERLEAIKKASVFRPGLRVEGRPYGGSPFGLDGRTFDVAKDGRIASAKDLGKGIGGLLGGMGGGGEKKGPKSKLERLILEVEITEVGSKGQVHRRALLARGSDEWPLLHASFLIETHPLPEGERDRRALGVLVENREVIEDLLGGEPGEADIHLHSEVSALLLRFSDLRRRILARQVAREKGDLKFFRERPGLIVETRQLVLDAEGGAVRLRHSIDIMENAVAFVSASGKRAPEAVLRLGVADTALESLLLVRSDPSDSAPSAWNLLQRARLHGGDRRLEDVEGKLRLAWGADAWWSVDPLTGACVGRVPSGAGQAMVEYAWNVAGKVCDVSMFLGMYTASGKAGETAKDVDKLVGNMCALHGGTGARDVAGGHIAEIKDALWKHTMSALAGMGGE